MKTESVLVLDGHVCGVKAELGFTLYNTKLRLGAITHGHCSKRKQIPSLNTRSIPDGESHNLWMRCSNTEGRRITPT